ncbi:MAG TPA: hypothetical protein VHK01_18415 [Lacipirellulaceae bacterium]|nr:hypothetical protein [Lacipirellulaceae bacterium]
MSVSRAPKLQSAAAVCRRGISLLAVALTACGCGSKLGLPDMVPIRGEVIYKGTPLTQGEGTVVYLPAELGNSRQATGAIQSDGTFQLTTMQPGDGAMKGKYKIVVYCYKPHPSATLSREEYDKQLRAGKLDRGSVIPEKYSNPASSGLSDVVDDSHSGFKRIELTDG